MKRKDFYIGLLVITISLHILGFILSPRNFVNFYSYLSFDPIISSTFYMEATILIFIFIHLLIREIVAMIKYDSEKK